MQKITFLLVFISMFGYAQEPITDTNIQTAVDLWVSDPSAATTTYGNISDWNVSQVTDMSNLFRNKRTFNDNIGDWDVSSVTNMYGMFAYARNFSQPLNNWDVSQVTDMRVMFDSAGFFNQPLNNWDVSSVTAIYAMFRNASSFNGDVIEWDVSSVSAMPSMFLSASSFNQNISAWDVSKVTNVNYMFLSASSFNQNISGWCVTNIASEPTDFSTNSPLIQSNTPVWGTCPTASIDDQYFTNLSIYPNPVENSLFISGNDTPISVSIYNVLGKEVISIKNTNNINVQTLPSGVYTIRISDGVAQTNRKFIKN